MQVKECPIKHKLCCVKLKIATKPLIPTTFYLIYLAIGTTEKDDLLGILERYKLKTSVSWFENG